MTQQSIEIIGVPLDLGANIRGANIGPATIRIGGLKKKLRALDYEVVDSGDLFVPIRDSLPDTAEEEKYLNAIADICEDLRKKVSGSLDHGCTPLIIGGDHSLAIGSIAGAANHFAAKKEDIGVIWIDAHADLNNHDTSPSGNIHGMPLSAILGDGHEKLTSIGGPGAKVKPENIALIGIRNIDGHEKEQVKKSGVNYWTMRQIDELGMFKVMQDALNAIGKNCAHIHLSFDIDGVDPLFAPGVSTPVSGGLSYREAHLALEMLADTGKLCSADFVEYNPIKDEQHKTALLAVELALSALGKSIV